MSPLMEWLAFLGFMAAFSLVFGFYMMNRKRKLWRRASTPETTKPLETYSSQSDIDTPTRADAEAVA